jgi:dihydropyrimidinase-like 2
VWDPAAGKTISAKKRSAASYNVFEGLECLGTPAATFSRGKIA